MVPSTTGGIGPRPRPGVAELDLVRCEQQIGFPLPAWLRARLARENGWQVSDAGGPTRASWRFLPVMDRSSRKSQSKTAEDIAWHTAALRAEAPGCELAVVVAVQPWGGRLVLLPAEDDSSELGPMLWRQNGVARPIAPPIQHHHLGRVQPVAASPRRLPSFRYHPDPVATGSIQHSGGGCPSCGEVTGWAYATTPYGMGEQPEGLCPWCIASGAAADRFGSQFCDQIVGDVPEEVAEELRLRTPGFVSWQGERWLAHCGDACAYLGPVGWDRLVDLPDARDALIRDGWPPDVLPLIRVDGDLSGYLFVCLTCGTYLAWADAS